MIEDFGWEIKAYYCNLIFLKTRVYRELSGIFEKILGINGIGNGR